MRLLVLGIAALLGCGGSHGTSQPAGPPTVAREYSATRWIPAKPTYAFAARSVRDGQRGLRDMIDSFGIGFEVDATSMGRVLKQQLTVDPMSVQEVGALGIDLDGGIAMFSEGVSPTFVIHLAAPSQTQAFFDQARQSGISTQSVLVDGKEVFTTSLSSKLNLSWVMVDDWLWLHFALPGGPSSGPDAGTRWFTSSYKPGAPTWSEQWQWAKDGAGKSTVMGFIDVRMLLQTLAPRVQAAVACVQLFEPVGRVAFSLEGDGHHAAGRIALDLGPSAQAIARAIMPPPEGWSRAAASAPLAVQWNLDLAVVRNWLAPCVKLVELDLAQLDSFGVRAGRVLLQRFDPDDKSGSGAIALDITNKRYFASMLGEIPLRSKFESNRTFGPHAGKSLSIPFGPSVDYVLTDNVALAAMGDGLLSSVVGKGSAATGPVFALDITPSGLSHAAWEFLLGAIKIPHPAAITDHLLRWHDGHFVLAVEGSNLVLHASGDRR